MLWQVLFLCILAMHVLYLILVLRILMYHHLLPVIILYVVDLLYNLCVATHVGEVRIVN